MKEAERSNELWQVGITSYRDGKVLAAIDDYSRFCFGLMPFEEVTTLEVIYFLADIFEHGTIPKAIITSKKEPFFDKAGKSKLQKFLDLANIKHIPASKEYGTQKLAAFFRTFSKFKRRFSR